MKILLFTFSFLFSVSIAKAEDFSYLLSMSKSEAIGLANRINSAVRVPWKFLVANESRSYLEVHYVPSSTTAEDFNKAKDIGVKISGVKYYTVFYKKLIVGEDKDMEIEGVTKYKFDKVKLKFLDAFRVWEKLFFNGTTMERVKAEEDCEVSVSDSGSKKLRISQSSPFWVINIL